MKLLLAVPRRDENVPRQLKRDILEISGTSHEVYTVREKGWNGKLNGELLKSMLDDQFEVLVTADKNLQHQQNFNQYPIPVVVLHTYRITYEYLSPLIPKLNELLKTDLPNGATVIKGE
ncbi:MAG: hypothetical protein AAF992_19705 [Bacteroidota bacterium]